MKISGWLVLRYDFDEKCDEEAELFLLRTVPPVRKGFGPTSPRSLARARASCHGQCLWYEQNPLADLCNRDAGPENCIHIKCKTILTPSRGAVARENTLILETSAPRGLVASPAAGSMIRLDMH